MLNDWLVAGTEIFEKALGELADRNVVTPAEATLGAAVELLQGLDRDVAFNPEEAPLTPWAEEIEGFLAASLPAMLYGGDLGEKAALSGLRLIARSPVERDWNPNLYPTVAVLLHHLTWATAACALAYDRLDIIPRLGRIQMSAPYPNQEGGVFSLVSLRYSDAFNREADRVYEDCQAWLLGLTFRERLAAWRRGLDTEASLAEAELLAALVFARTESDLAYSHVARTSGSAERRLRERLQDLDARRELARLLEVEPDRLTHLVGELYDRIAGPNRLSRVTLFPER